MKVLYSWLREFVDVTASPDEIAALMGVRGFAGEGLERLGDDAIIDFEVTGNRPDCMSVVGMAREIATAYDLPLRSGIRDQGSKAPIPDPRSLIAAASRTPWRSHEPYPRPTCSRAGCLSPRSR